MGRELKCLFNFAVSYSGGGFKRLYEYANWFNAHGGASFIIHPRCESVIEDFPNNRFYVVDQPRYRRGFNDCGYLATIKKDMGQPELYYSYGIPIYGRLSEINWFHLSNVLPFSSRGVHLPPLSRLKAGCLGWRFTRALANADVISAESIWSLDLLDAKHVHKRFLSVNGSDDELAYLQNAASCEKDNIATVLGTHTYKAIEDSYSVFEMLKQRNSDLKLVIIGNEATIPQVMRRNSDVIAVGVLRRAVVMEWLRKTKYYISTTRIENSYNAAAEGVFFADESYISDIGPHRELLKNERFNRIVVPAMSRPLLHVHKEHLSGLNLKRWDEIIGEMMRK